MEPSPFFLAAPSTVQVGETFGLGVKVLAAPRYVGASCYRPVPGVQGPYNVSPRGIRYMDNVPEQWGGIVDLAGGDEYQGPRAFTFDGVPGPYVNDRRPITRIEGLRFSSPGTKYVEVRDRESGRTALSNPIVVTAESWERRLFWGDLHSQTFFSDGLRCPEELHAFARDEAFLDIFALSDHTEHLTDRQWDYFVSVTNDYNQAHRFATLVGLEWTSPGFGHRNVYYPGDRGAILRANDDFYGKLANVYAHCRAEGALCIPHHSANVVMGVNWELGHDPTVERLVELNSIWGVSERPAAAGNPRPIRNHEGEKPGQHVVDALKRGYRFGFLGGGDIHDGRPGDELHNCQEHPEEYSLLRRQGIMGVWARELTREAVFEALWERRCFATTNVRTYLEFEVCGQPMGSETTCGGARSLRVRAASEVPFARMDLVRNGDDLVTIAPEAREVGWVGEDAGEGACDWYYVRLTRADGEMAWSSPVWVTG
jgi:hypothetical protein